MSTGTTTAKKGIDWLIGSFILLDSWFPSDREGRWNPVGLSLKSPRFLSNQWGPPQFVGEYFVDLLVEHAIMVELKTVQQLNSAHRAQCLNYLRATGLHLCLLMNFGSPRLEVRRVVLGL